MSITDTFERESKTIEARDKAKELGIPAKNFDNLLKAYRKKQSMFFDEGNVTEFEGQPCELACGQYRCSDEGIFLNGLEICSHPIIPVERLKDIEDGTERLKLWYSRGETATGLPRCHETIFGKTTLANAAKITELSSVGIGVTSLNAKDLAEYLAKMEALNYDAIPERKSVSRLGFFRSFGFAPYVDNLAFAGEGSSKGLFESVVSHGNYNSWKQTAMECRNYSTAAKIMLADSFGSPLLAPLNALPFFVHLWCIDSESGKTVALMLAVSVWGNPSLTSPLMASFNSTPVGLERTAAFLNHLPLCLDELQLIKAGKGDFNPYLLAEGKGRLRGIKTGGTETLATWQNIILSTGESPLTGDNSAGGAVNRVVNMECPPGESVVDRARGNEIVNALCSSFGHAGKEFVKKLYPDVLTGRIAACIRPIFAAYQNELQAAGVTSKQAISGAVLLTVDKLACEWIFDGQAEPLSAVELIPFLATKKDVNTGAKAYSFLCDWVQTNAAKFCTGGGPLPFEIFGKVTGTVSGGETMPEDWTEVSIIKSVFNKALKSEGFDPNAVLSWLKEHNYVDGQDRDRFSGLDNPRQRCVRLKLVPGQKGQRGTRQVSQSFDDYYSEEPL